MLVLFRIGSSSTVLTEVLRLLPKMDGKRQVRPCFSGSCCTSGYSSGTVTVSAGNSATTGSASWTVSGCEGA